MPTPFMPTADITDRTEEELRQLESDEREALEARIQWLRDIQTLIDSAVQQMNQYTQVSILLTVTQADRFILMNKIVIHKGLQLPIPQTPFVLIYDEYRDGCCPCYTHKRRKCRKRRNLGWTNVTPPQTSQSRVDKRHTTH